MNRIKISWFKCDLHLHTAESRCFKNSNTNAKDWVNEAIKKGLNCVAVTDHNSSKNIDIIKEAAKNTSLTVFPGVELSCDPSKIHLLVLFDPSKSSVDVRNFLIECYIPYSSFGETTTLTKMSIFDVIKVANDFNALVIPAHIDEYKGLGNLDIEELNKLFSNKNIKAVQFVHKKFISRKSFTSEDLLDYLNKFYRYPRKRLTETTIQKWSSPIKLAKEKNLALLTFSDNPSSQDRRSHGIEGIGNQFTWIKMKYPSIESLKKAFHYPKTRIKNCFDAFKYNKLHDLYAKNNA